MLKRIAGDRHRRRPAAALGDPHALVDRADLAGRHRRLRGARRRPVRPAHLRADRRGHRRGDPRGRRPARARTARRRHGRPAGRLAQPQFDPFSRTPRTPARTAAGKAASIDPDLTVAARRLARRAPIGVWSNFAIHPTSFGDDNLLFSGDNAAFAERIAEAEISERGASRLAPPPRRPRERLDQRATRATSRPTAAADGRRRGPPQYATGPYAGAHMPGERVADGIVRAWRDGGQATSTTARRSTPGARSSTSTARGRRRAGRPVPVLGAAGIVGHGRLLRADRRHRGARPGDEVPGARRRAGSSRRRPGVGLADRLARHRRVPGRDHQDRWASASAARSLAESGGRLDRFAIAGLTNAYVSYTATPEEYDACHYEGCVHAVRPPPGRALRRRRRAAGRRCRRAHGAGGRRPSRRRSGWRAGSAAATDARRRRTGDTARRRPPPRARQRSAGTAATPPRRAARRTLVTVEREHGGGWPTVATDDGFQDITERSATRRHVDRDVPVRRLRSARHLPLPGDRGRRQGLRAEPYKVTSATFELLPTPPLVTRPPRSSRAARWCVTADVRGPGGPTRCWPCRAGCAPGRRR